MNINPILHLGRARVKFLYRNVQTLHFLFRFEGEIIRYGFHFDNFRVVVKTEKYEDVKKALLETGSGNFCKIDVIRQEDFKETVVPFNGNLRAQGSYSSLLQRSRKKAHKRLKMDMGLWVLLLF